MTQSLHLVEEVGDETAAGYLQEWTPRRVHKRDMCVPDLHCRAHAGSP